MPEHQTCEYKREWTDGCLKEVCAFANADGGTLYIGVDDDGRVVGCAKAKKLLADIPNQVNNALGMVVRVELGSRSSAESDPELTAPKEEASYLKVQVAAQSSPITYQSVVYFRSGSVSLRLEGNALTTFFLEKLGVQWDKEVLPGITDSQLDQESFEIFCRNSIAHGRRTEEQLAISRPQLLHSLHLIEKGEMTRAAVLLFHREPDRWFPKAYVRIGMFGGPAELLYQDELHGSLLMQAERAVDLIFTKYLKAAVSYQGVHRVETYPFPPEAVREAMYNALIHSDYSKGNAIRVRVDEFSLSITNDGNLPVGFTPERMKETRYSKAHNPLIASAFYEAGFVERWGRGMATIFNACRRHGIAVPEYACNNGMVTVTFEARPVISTLSNEAREALLLKMIAADPQVSIPTLSERSGISMATLRRIVKKLQDDGSIMRVGGARGGAWQVLHGGDS